MSKRKFCFCLISVLITVFFLTAASFADVTEDQQVAQSLEKAVNYLHKHQNDDGGFPSKEGQPSSRAVTSWVVMALTAAGEDVTSSAWKPAGKSPLDYLYSCESELEETAEYARMLLSLSAADQESVYQDIDLAEKIAFFQEDNGQFYQPDKNEEGMINAHMWSILALASAEREIPNEEMAKKWLLENQNEDGGFGWLVGTYSDTDDTAVAIQALITLGENPLTSSAIKSALNYLQENQLEDGGFSSGNDWMEKESNSASDAWVIQGLLAAGENPQSEKWSVNGKNAIEHLLSLQNSDGSFAWKKGIDSSPVKMTAYAVMALAGKPHPINLNNSAKVNFSDLSPSYWAYDSIMKLVNQKIVSGYPDGTFKPDNDVTRAELTKYLVCGLGLENSVYKFNQDFPDISKDNWARNYILTAVAKGYVQGRPDGKFDPNGKINGAELAAMMVRALPDKDKASLSEGPYWYSGYVKIAKEKSLLYPDFRATENATRAQCAYSIERLQRLLETEN